MANALIPGAVYLFLYIAVVMAEYQITHTKLEIPSDLLKLPGEVTSLPELVTAGVPIVITQKTDLEFSVEFPEHPVIGTDGYFEISGHFNLFMKLSRQIFKVDVPPCGKFSETPKKGVQITLKEGLECGHKYQKDETVNVQLEVKIDEEYVAEHRYYDKFKEMKFVTFDLKYVLKDKDGDLVAGSTNSYEMKHVSSEPESEP